MKSQKEQILEYLKTGKAINGPLHAVELFGCFAVSQRVGELRREGFPIESRLVTAGGSGKKVSRYWMKIDKV